MKSLFQNLITNNKLAHGYIFFGLDQSAQLTLATWLAKRLEGDESFLVDCLEIKPIENNLGINQIRGIKNFLWQKPVRSAKRTVIIQQANFLTVEAQNAILKIAEEPPAHALIILLIRESQTLLGTLVSRFQKIYVPNDSNYKDQVISLSVKKYASDLLKGTVAQRKQIIKDVLEQDNDHPDSQVLSGFVSCLMLELSRNKVKNWRILKELLHRWRMINQFNLNKRLQLEAWSKFL